MANAAYRKNYSKDILTGGGSSITGTIQVSSVNAERDVFLIEQESLRVRRKVRSSSTGQFSFTNLKAGIQWMILCIDEKGQFNAGIKSHEST